MNDSLGIRTANCTLETDNRFLIAPHIDHLIADQGCTLSDGKD